MLAGYRNPVRCPLRPALWEGGLRATEDRWRAALAGRRLLPRLAPAAAGGPRTRRDPAFDAPCMRQPPLRLAPAQRTAGNAERAQRAARRPPLPDDTVDPLDVAERPPAWASVWTDVYDLDIERRHRCTAFRMLYAQLRVGMFTGYIRHPITACGELVAVCFTLPVLLLVGLVELGLTVLAQ